MGLKQTLPDQTGEQGVPAVREIFDPGTGVFGRHLLRRDAYPLGHTVRIKDDRFCRKLEDIRAVAVEVDRGVGLVPAQRPHEREAELLDLGVHGRITLVERQRHRPRALVAVPDGEGLLTDLAPMAERERRVVG